MGKIAQLKDPKTWPFILLRVQSPYVATRCTPYNELNVFFYTVNTTAAVNNPCLQYQLHVPTLHYSHPLTNHYKNVRI
jgi:uncharacterized protein affecting Mg2+/Co2+ transport